MYLENRTFRILLIASPAHCVADQIDWVFDLALVEVILRERTRLPPTPLINALRETVSRPRGNILQRKKTGKLKDFEYSNTNRLDAGKCVTTETSLNRQGGGCLDRYRSRSYAHRRMSATILMSEGRSSVFHGLAPEP